MPLIPMCYSELAGRGIGPLLGEPRWAGLGGGAAALVVGPLAAETSMAKAWTAWQSGERQACPQIADAPARKHLPAALGRSRPFGLPAV